jgi:hypothetical protein
MFLLRPTRQLGVYDRMKNELIDTEASEAGNLLLQCLHNSSAITLRVCDEDGPRPYHALLGTMGLSVCA